MCVCVEGERERERKGERGYDIVVGGAATWGGVSNSSKGN